MFVLILISLFFLVSISFFHLISGLPLSFNLRFVICVVYVYKNPMPSSVIGCHHVNLANHSRPLPSLLLSLKMNTSYYLFWISYPFYFFVCDPFCLFHVCRSTPSTPSFKCDWFVFVHVCKSLQRESMTMVVLMKKQMNDFDPSQCTSIK